MAVLMKFSAFLPCLSTERPAVIFVWFIPSNRIFPAKAVYMVLGSSYLFAREILVLGSSLHYAQAQPVAFMKLNTENTWR